VEHTDQAILRRLQSGDLHALESLYRAYEGVVFNLGRRLCGTDHDADDVLQETFLEVTRSARHYRGEGPVVGWIKKICINKSLMRLRRAGRFVEQTLEDSDEIELVPSLRFAFELEPSMPDPDMELALHKLNSLARIVVWLHDVEGYTHEEIAQLLGKTVSFSKSQLSRAHARLRQLLKEGTRESACGI
jgi:RNA polymerase sigma-70 factor (ECF subfamily)